MQIVQLKRREVIALLGGSVAWPLAARAQAMPTVGIMTPASPTTTLGVRFVIHSMKEFGWDEPKGDIAALQQTTPSFDHLVGQSEQRGWHRKTERLSGLEIDHQFNFAALLDGEV